MAVPKVPADKVELYRKIKALAERAGTEGEEDQAERTLAAMRLKYDGIDDAAEAAERADARKGKDANWFTGAPAGARAPEGTLWDRAAGVFKGFDLFLNEIKASFDVAITANELCTAVDETGDIEMKEVVVKGEKMIRISAEWNIDDFADILDTIGDSELLRDTVAAHVGNEIAKFFKEMVDQNNAEGDVEAE